MTALPALDPEISDLGLALGLLTDTGSGPEFDSSWFSSPGDHLSHTLSDDNRRHALVRFVEAVLGDGQHTEAGGVTYLHLFDLRTLTGDTHQPDLTVQVSLDDQPATYTEIGVVARLQTETPATTTTLQVPLYRAAKQGQSVPQPFALLAGGVITVSTDLTFSTAPPATGDFGLAGLTATVATALTSTATPEFSLVLKGLHLPGAAAPSDLTIGGPGVDLEHTLLSLVLGLVRQTVDSLSGAAATEVQAALSLVGLGTAAGIPALPIDQLLTHGAGALRDWFVQVMGSEAARQAWLAAVGSLLGGTPSGDVVTIPIGTGPVRALLGFSAVTGAAGHLLVTPSLGLELQVDVAGAVRLGVEAIADLVTIDTATGALKAIPNLDIAVTATGFGTGDAADLLHTGTVDIGSVRLGLTVRDGVPQALVQARAVTFAGVQHDVIDLSSPAAVVAAAGQLAEQLLGQLLDGLGSAGAELKGLLGLVPTGGMAALDGARLLSDPLGALADWWHDLFTNHAADVPAVLTRLRNLIAGPLQLPQSVAVADPIVGPWSMLIADRFQLDLALVDGALTIEPVVSLRVDTLGGGCTVVLTELRVRLATIDLAQRHVAFPLATTFSTRLRGRGSTQARLGLGPVAVTADYIGLQAAWSPTSPFTVGMACPNLSIDAGDQSIPLALPTVDAAGHLVVPTAGWDAIEALVGTLAASADNSWLNDLVGLIGWSVVDPAIGPKLSLADLVANPVPALRTWLGRLATDPDLVSSLTAALAHLISGSAQGLAGVFDGSGTPADPWSAALGGNAPLPAIAVWMTPDGPPRSPSLTQPALTNWRPGQPGLDAGGLAQGLYDEARAGDEVAELAAGRESVATGLTALRGRWTGTDGRVAPPTPAMTGLQLITQPNLDWTALAGLDLVGLVGSALPPVVVRVAVGAVADLPAAWTPAAGRLIDLTQPALPPTSFAVTDPAAGEWVVALAPRADATLGGAADPGGLVGQSGRLIQVLQQLAPFGPIALVAYGGAGSAARVAADTVTAVSHLITLGSPWSAATFDSARNGIPGDALRLLQALLPAMDPSDPDDDDLAHGRALVTGFLDAVRNRPRATELEATRPDTAIRAGLTAIGVFGVLDDDAVGRALTAVFASGLAARAQARAGAALAPATATHLGVRLPFSLLTPPGGHGITLSGTVILELGSVAAADASITLAPAITFEFSLADTDNWLIGGPGTSPLTGAQPLELRRLSGQVSIGLGGGASRATLALAEGSAFGADWVRLLVEPPSSATGAIETQPLLPEAQALLNALTTKLAAAAPTSPAGLFATLINAAGLTGAGGALIPNAMAYLLHDAGAQLRSILAAPATRAALLAALAGLVPGFSVTGDVLQVTAGPLTGQADLGTETVSLTAAGNEGLVHWTAGAQVTAGGHISVSAGLGDPTVDPFALVVQSGPVRAELRRSGGQTPIALFPTPDLDGLIGLAVAAVPAEAVRVMLEGLRTIDADLGGLVDALADGLGLLGPADADGVRSIRTAVGLFADPVGWFRTGVLGSGGGFDPNKVIELAEAIKPFVGLAGTPRGVWPVSTGVQVLIAAAATGSSIALALDATSWLAGAANRSPFAAGISLGLTLPATGAPHPNLELFLGVPDNADGTSSPQHRRAAHLIIDGSQVELLLRPSTGADIEIFPHPAGLGSLLQAGVTQVLPEVLNQLASMAGDAVRTEIADVVGAIGRGLGLATGAPAVFDPTALSTLAADPASYLRSHLGTLLTEAGAALDPVLVRLLGLPAGQHAAVLSSAGVLTVTIRTVVVELHPTPLSVSVTGAVSGLPVVNDVALSVTVDGTGLAGWSAQVGPAAINLDGPVLRPFARVGSAGAAGWQVDLGLGLDATAIDSAGHQELTARWRQAGGLSMLVTTRVDASTVAEDTSPGGLAVAAIDAVLELVGGWVLGIADVQSALAKPLGSKTVRFLLDGSILTPTVNPPTLLPGVLEGWPGKLLTLAAQLVACAPTVTAGPVVLGLSGDGGVLGASLNLSGPVPLTSGDTALTLEVDASWIDPPATPGIVLEVLKVDGATLTPALGIKVDGIGVRLGKSSGPLIDDGLRLDSIAVHLAGSVETGSGPRPVLGGGVQLQLNGLAVPLGSGGGDNAVAQGIMSDAGGSGTPPRPAFSPALAVQDHGAGLQFSLSAGSGDGPWYLPIQRAFGPVYLEQIGLGVQYRQNLTPRQLEIISLYLSGQVSLLGLTAAVDNLRFSYHVSAPFFSPQAWEVDIDGFAIAADFGPLTLAGGLAKFPLGGDLTGVEYLGMLKIGFNSYGLDLFGGYAHPTSPDGSQFASFFAFGALHAPIGGVPAFFITGIGLGLGINRDLQAPTIDNVNTHPFMLALRATGPTPEPMKQLQDMRVLSPPKRGEFWVAGGISFTSFVLITGEILVTVQFGDGLEIAILGLARTQLPTADLTLVSIELALLARFSEKEGLVLVQAQLTDNSWLLDKSVRLTGGFAFETWWKGPNAGQFVVTVGGYHPRFHHDGYPQVPRVGFNWQPADEISVSGGVYFALCSEAIMAGASLHAAAHLGPAHASLDLGGDGIIFFDPFFLDVSVYAEARVGITIWLLFGSVDIDVSLGFDIELEGPPFYLHGHFSVCGVGIPFEIGSPPNPADNALTADQFAAKYLRGDSAAQVVQASVLRGAITAGKSSAPDSGGVDKAPDGSADHPFRLVPEFLLSFISTAPTQNLTITSPAGNHATTVSAPGLGVGPMYADTLDSSLTITLTSDTGQTFDLNAVRLTARPGAAYPKGVWGRAQNPQAKAIPAGDTVAASDGLTIDTMLPESLFTGAPPIDYHQIELPLHGRKPLPFITNRAHTDARVTAAKALRDAATVFAVGNPDADLRFSRAAKVMSASGGSANTLEQFLAAGGAQPTTTSALRGDRVAPPSFGSLADDLVDSPDAVSPAVTPTVVDRTPPARIRLAPLVKSVLGAPMSLALDRPSGTTVSAPPADAVTLDPPTLAGVRATVVGRSQLALHLVPRSAQALGKTVGPVGISPLTRLASGAVAAVANARSTPAAAARLAGLTAALAGPGTAIVGRRGKAVTGGATVHEGELAVITVDDQLDSTATDTLQVFGGATRVLCLGAGGRLLSDQTVGADGAPAAVTLPNATERVAVLAIGATTAVAPALPGWAADQSLPTLGWGVALGSGVVLSAQGQNVRPNRERADGGWVIGRELCTAGLVVTAFTDPVTAIAVAIDDQVGGDAAADVSIRLQDADRTLDAAGDPLPPQVLVDGVRSILIYAVQPTGSNPRVFVDGATAGELAGVVGATSDVATIAAILAVTGLAAAVAQPLIGGPGLRQLTFVPATPPSAGTPAANLKPPIKKAPAKKANSATKAAPKKAVSAQKTVAKKVPAKKVPAKKAAAPKKRPPAKGTRS